MTGTPTGTPAGTGRATGTGAATVLALDLGTGGCKASLWTAQGACLAEAVAEYPTHHPAAGRNEQRPADWWRAVVTAAREVTARRPAGTGVDGVSLSGHSLGTLLLDRHGEPVEPVTPIWSDARAGAEAAAFFARFPERDWYERTGNGFPPALYPLFKAAWYRAHRPESWARARVVTGCKDWINLRLTGELATDHTYASGSGAYDLTARGFDPELLAAGGLDPALLPPLREATDVVGTLTREAADALGLTAGTPVLAGAVDNACMALGSRGTAPGRIFAALGSSSWITVTTAAPVLDFASRPYVFAHAVPGLFVSALSTFSSGSSIEWLRDLIAPGMSVGAFVDEAGTAPALARGVLMLPMLSGGTPLEGGPAARGVLCGLDLAHGRADVARAGLEGVAYALRRSLDEMRRLTPCEEELLITGGGSRHPLWNRIYADVLGVPLLRTGVERQAAALGTAAIGFVGIGAWRDFAPADAAHAVTGRHLPEPAAAAAYATGRRRFEAALAAHAALAAERDSDPGTTGP
ncbi:xylulokinase [Streptomyces hoynatensis]|uniref:Pentose kinase n=1 Tax=Streptomyces hoynatensis TaxID=1141874 RepID=A0A3A9YTU9_9ACTN|nr:FGGY family carbohydrate kinase [Streptomyces hoynatensis]RKN39483.1 pentose kinase [Streptomyces hoynatensis]